MARYAFSIHVEAPPDNVFSLWVDLQRMGEWDGTRVTQEFETVGRISAVSSWLFSRGSYEGSFRGELQKFGRIAEREAGRSGDA